MPKTLQPLIDFIRLGRPLFLVGGVVFHLLGISLAVWRFHHLNILGAGLLQIVITASQWMTHYANDYFDREGDALNQTPTAWSGGSRVLPEGRLSPRVALAAAVAWLTVALAGMAAITLIIRPGPLALPMMISGAAVGWFYSATPVRLVGRGLGEIIGALTVPGLTAALGYTLQTNRLDPLVLWASLPLILIQFAMLLAVGSPDQEADAASNKRTLVVWVGRERAGRLYGLALLLAYAIPALTLLISGGSKLTIGPTAPGALVLMPLAAWQGWNAMSGGWRNAAGRGTVAFWTVALLIGTALTETIVCYL